MPPLARRLLLALSTVVVAITLTFFLVRSMPGDVLQQWAVRISQDQGVSLEEAHEIARAMLSYNPDEPVLSQYLRYMGRVAQGDLGLSMTYRIPVLTIIRQALPWTLLITGLATLVSFPISAWLG
ncbi:MAG TPA: ABC transporter permease, partial [Candidatus Xenobia bacterium]